MPSKQSEDRSDGSDHDSRPRLRPSRVDQDGAHEKKKDNTKKGNKKEPFIGDKDEAPEWLQQSYIERGYRINFKKFTQALKSLFMWHNETTNIWTHLSGLLLFVGIMIYITIFVGGFSPTKPMDAVMNQLFRFIPDLTGPMSRHFDKHLNSTNLASQNITEIGVKLWQESVESYNPKFFIGVNQSLPDEDHSGYMFESVFLYETDDAFINLLVGKLVDADTEPSYNRSKLHEHYTQICTSILYRIQVSILYAKENDRDRVKPLKDIQRNIAFHKDSENIKNLIIHQEVVDDSYIQGDEKTFTNVTKLPLYVFMATALICLGFSSIYHTFNSQSDEIDQQLSRFDYGGISILVMGSVIPPYFYTFYCPETFNYAIGYTIFIVVVSIGVFCASLMPKMADDGMKTLRALMYVGQGIAAFSPAFHVMMADDLYLYPFHKVFWLSGSVIYLIGTFLYAVKFPERYFPRRFDYFGMSHNIFHIFVVIAAVCHFLGALSNYHGRKVLTC